MQNSSNFNINSNNNFYAFQSDTPFNESGLNIKNSIKDIGLYKGLTDFNFDSSNYSIITGSKNSHKKNYTNKAIKMLNEEERINFNKKHSNKINNDKFESYNHSSNISYNSYNQTNDIINIINSKNNKVNSRTNVNSNTLKSSQANLKGKFHISYKDNKNIVEFKRCKQVKNSKVYSLKGSVIGRKNSTVLNKNLQETLISPHELFDSEFKDTIKENTNNNYDSNITNAKNNIKDLDDIKININNYNYNNIKNNKEFDISPLNSNYVPPISLFNTNKAVIEKNLLNELELDLKEFSTNKTSKLTNRELEKIIDDVRIQLLTI